MLDFGMLSKSNLTIIAAENIKNMRVDLGLSQEELAARSGLHRTYIGGVERGERNITLKSLERIALALNVTPAEIVTQKQNHV